MMDGTWRPVTFRVQFAATITSYQVDRDTILRMIQSDPSQGGNFYVYSKGGDQLAYSEVQSVSADEEVPWLIAMCSFNAAFPNYSCRKGDVLQLAMQTTGNYQLFFEDIT